MTARGEAPLIWDAHVCLPLHPDADLGVLRRHHAAGASFVSVNVGMDLNPLEQILPVLASFRRQILAHPDLFVLAGTVAEVEAAHAARRLAIGFDLEGALPLCGRPETVDLFRALGVRQMHLAYNRSNAIAGGCYDEDRGLSKSGRAIVRAMRASGVVLDGSHMGERSSLEAIEAFEGPIVFSHANPRRLRDDLRNLTDAQIDACAASGGVVCVTGVARFLPEGRAAIDGMLDAIGYLVGRVGAAHVGIGTDASYPAGPLDDDPPGLRRDFWWPPAHGYAEGLAQIEIVGPESLPSIAEGLERRGHSAGDSTGILGRNMLELARRIWSSAP